MPFPIEKASTKKITNSNGGVKISGLVNYPVRGLVFEGGNTLEDLSNTVSDACICLQDNNIPYNVLISDCGRQIFLLPQVKLSLNLIQNLFALDLKERKKKPFSFKGAFFYKFYMSKT